MAELEGIHAEPEALNIIAQKADGALRDALSIFDQMVSFSGKEITYKAVIDNLNVLDYDYYFKIVDDMLSGNTTDILLTLNDIISKGFEPQHFINGMGNHLRNLLVSKDPATTSLLEVSEQLRQRYVSQSQQCPLPFLIRALDLNDRCDIDYRSCSNKRLHLEVNLLKMMNMEDRRQKTEDRSNTAAPNPRMGGANPPQPIQRAETPIQAPKPQAPIQTPKPEVPIQTPKPEAPIQTPKPEVPIQTPKPEAPHVETRQRPRGGASTISINNTMEQVAKKEEEEPTWDTPFTQEQLETSWNEFVTKYKKISPNFAAGLGKYKPTLKAGFEIHFPVDNMLFESDTEGMTALRSHLKNTLHNNRYQLIPELMDRPAEIEAYTDKEKFEKLAQAHPELRKLQMELRLEGDL